MARHLSLYTLWPSHKYSSMHIEYIVPHLNKSYFFPHIIILMFTSTLFARFSACHVILFLCKMWTSLNCILCMCGQVTFPGGSSTEESGTKRFTCSYPGCTGSYAYSQSLRRHENTCHGRVPQFRGPRFSAYQEDVSTPDTVRTVGGELPRWASESTSQSSPRSSASAGQREEHCNTEGSEAAEETDDTIL